MDNSNKDKYAQICTDIILEETDTIISQLKVYSFSAEKLFLILKEFLLFGLHLCDKNLFGFFGADLRKDIMDRIITKIAMFIDEIRETSLGEVLNKVKSIDKVLYEQKIVDNQNHTADILKRSRDIPTAEDFIANFNQVQVEYSKYKLVPQEFYTYTTGILEWEFSKKLASLLGHDTDAFFMEAVALKARILFYKLYCFVKKAKDKI